MMLTLKLAGMSLVEPELVLRVTEAWVELAGSGMTLVSCNRKLRGVDDYAGFFSAEGPQMLQVVMATRKRLRQADTACQKVAQQLEEADKDSFASLLELTTPEAFLTELSSEQVNDILAWKFAHLQESLATATKELSEETSVHLSGKGAATTSFQDLLATADGPHSWTAELKNDAAGLADFDCLYHAASLALFPVAPGRILKAFADKSTQEMRQRFHG